MKTYKFNVSINGSVMSVNQYGNNEDEAALSLIMAGAKILGRAELICEIPEVKKVGDEVTYKAFGEIFTGIIEKVIKVEADGSAYYRVNNGHFKEVIATDQIAA